MTVGVLGGILALVFLTGAAHATAAPVTGVFTEKSRIRVENETLSAVFDKALLVSLVRRSDGRQLIRASPNEVQGVYLIYPFAEAVPFGNRDTDMFTPYRINSLKAEFRIEGFDGDGIMSVEGWTPTEGMIRLEETVASLGGGLVLGGEWRNEVTMRSQAFGQVHLLKSWFTNIPGLERLQIVPLGQFLYGDWCKAFGYQRLGGATPEEALRMKLQLNQGSVPTITVGRAADIDNANAAVLEMLDIANRMAKAKVQISVPKK